MSYNTGQRFKFLCQVSRAAHFEWREVFRKMFPEKDVKEAVLNYWEIVGHDTSRAYLKKLDRNVPVVPQLAQFIVDSSLGMGESAKWYEGSDRESYVEHTNCPWYDWHKKYDALDEDQAGCDCWLQTMAKDFNNKLGTNIEIETVSSIPSGDDRCRRVITNKNK